jgi:lactate permease
MAFATVFAMSGTRGVKGALPAIFVTGFSFAVMEFIIANFLGATLVDVLASIVCLTSLAAYLSCNEAREVWLFPGETAPSIKAERETNFRELFLSWLPYILLAVFIIGVNLPSTKPIFGGRVPGTEFLLIRGEIYNPNKLYALTWLQSPGTIMLIAGLAAFQFMGIRFAVVQEQFFKTFKQMIPSFIAVACILSIFRGHEPGAADSQRQNQGCGLGQRHRCGASLDGGGNGQEHREYRRPGDLSLY